jgi:tetratricopeptide (TPR) repeat protein
MGALARQSGRFEDALTWFRGALDGMTPGSAGEAAARTHGLTRADIQYRIGETELVLGRVPDAKRHTLDCLAAEPEHYWGWFQWGLILAAEGDRAEAIRELERLVARYPEHGAAMMHLGMQYRAAGDRVTAERWFLRARAVLPDKSLADAELHR